MIRALGRGERAPWDGIEIICMGIYITGRGKIWVGWGVRTQIRPGLQPNRVFINSHLDVGVCGGPVRISNEDDSNESCSHEKVNRGPERPVRNPEAVPRRPSILPTVKSSINAWISLNSFPSSTETSVQFSNTRLFCYKRTNEGGREEEVVSQHSHSILGLRITEDIRGTGSWCNVFTRACNPRETHLCGGNMLPRCNL